MYYECVCVQLKLHVCTFGTCACLTSSGLLQLTLIICSAAYNSIDCIITYAWITNELLSEAGSIYCWCLVIYINLLIYDKV